MASRILLLLLVSFYFTANAQNNWKAQNNNWKKMDGFIPFWWDESMGRIWWEVDRLEQEMLYVNSLSSGLGSNDIGLDRGQLGNSRIVKFQRIGRRLFLTQPNYSFRAITSDATERRAVEESFAQSVIASFLIEEEKDGKLLIDATPFLVRDAHGIADKIRTARQGTYVFNDSRSAMYMQRTKNFPKNSEFEAIITFTGGSDAGRLVRSVTPSAEAITLRVHHSLVQLPDTAGFRPRKFDVRSGYFGISYYNFSSPVDAPIQEMLIARHRLNKKDPTALKSEPVQPIVYYLDPGTPEPIRSALLEGGAWWNQAFEAAGYINAFQIKMLPVDADPMDIRYNMINWVHRSTRGWSYGASVTDPRTGEIIKGQVTLGSLRVRQDYLIFTGLLSPFEEGKTVSETMKQAALQRIRELSAHEIGHTLGLMHNYSSSVHNRASVMDYPHPLIKLKGKELDFSDVYTNEIGAWDKRAIMYGYQDFPKGTDEESALKAILDETHQLGLSFLSDADARAPGGMHPDAHLWDNGMDAADELMRVMEVRKVALQQFSKEVVTTGTPLSKMEDALVPVYNYHRYQVEAVTKSIAGLKYQYSVKGTKSEQIVQPLSANQQVKAMKAVLSALDPAALVLPEQCLQWIPPRPPMYEQVGEVFYKRTGMLLDAMSPAEAFTDYVFSFIFHPERMQRLIQQKALYQLPGLDDVLDTLISHLYKKPLLKNAYKAQIQWQLRHQLLSWMMGSYQSDRLGFEAKSILHNRIQLLSAFSEAQAKQQPTQAAAFSFIVQRVKDKASITLPRPAEIAQGAPIGCDHEW